MRLVEHLRSGSVLAALAFGASVAPSALATVIASSNFSTDADGWVLVNYDGTGAPASPTWNSSGYVTATDLFSDGFWRAPVAFRGNLSSAYGGSLSYDVFSDYQSWAMTDIYIQGSAGTLSYRFASQPTSSFSTFTASLTSSAGWMWGLAYTNPLTQATAGQIQSVLANVTDIRIRQEYGNGADFSGLDNVVLATAPIPGPLWLLALGGAGLFAERARRRSDALIG